MKVICPLQTFMLLLSLLAVQYLASGEIYSEYSEKILKNVKRVIVSFEDNIQLLVPHFMDEDKMLKNANFYNKEFTDDLNTAFDKIEAKKNKIYEVIKKILTKVYAMAKMEKAFDLNLRSEDQLMMKFVINLDASFRTPEMKRFWHHSLSSKNGMFASVDLLKKSILSCSINLVNFYDNMEEFRNECQLDDEADMIISEDDVARYKYITGFLQRTKEMYLLQNDIFKEINQNMLSVNQDILEWNKSFSELKGYMEDFMTGKTNESDKEEEEVLAELQEEIANGEDPTDLHFAPEEGNDYKPSSDPQNNTENAERWKEEEAEHEEINLEEITDPIEYEVMKKKKEEQEKKEIEHLAILKIQSMETQLNKEEMDKEQELLEKELADNAEAVKTCNKVLLMNYSVEGHIEAEEIPIDEPLPGCPDIRHSCCSKEEIERTQRSFLDETLPKYAKRYYIMRKMVKTLLKNYSKFTNLAYDIMKIQGADPICHQAAENIIFTPIGKHFVTVFFKKLEKAHNWILKAKSGFFCSLCNQANHHTIFEFDQIIFKREFCQSNIDNTFDFVSIWYMNIADFFNGLINLLQCDKTYGKYSEENELEPFGLGPRGKELVKQCLNKEKSFCVDYCAEFEFSEAVSFYDPPIERIKAFYDFAIFRMNDYYEIEIKTVIDTDLFHMLDDELMTERFSEGYIRLDNPTKIFSKKFEDHNAANPVLYGADTETIKEAVFIK